jgi:uncharacterized caspase-like protein
VRALARLLVGCVAFAAAVAVANEPDRRIALVIGNGAYKTGPLKNPTNDAQAVAASLKNLGFDVALRENTTYRELVDAIRQFSGRAREADVRLVFYAGHGIQAKGRNYLLPVDADITAEEDVPAKSADVNDLLERLGQVKQGVNIVILDACRNNPFAGNDVVLPDGRRLKYRGATQGGLARMEAPLGTFLAFSTAPGGVALDNPKEKNSLYTKHLLANIDATGVPIEQLFKQVRAGVASETGRIQTPWETSSLTGDFCFKSAGRGGCVIATRPGAR